MLVFLNKIKTNKQRSPFSQDFFLSFSFLFSFTSSQKGTIKLINTNTINRKKVLLFQKSEDSLKFYNKYLPEVKVFSFKFDEENAVGLDIF